jgi:hypothetical protein
MVERMIAQESFQLTGVSLLEIAVGQLYASYSALRGLALMFPNL